MKRFGSTEAFLDILGRARGFAPEAGARSNVIVGFPGETEADVAELERFLIEARLDVVGVEHVTALVEELMAQRAEDRIATAVDVLVDEVGDEGVFGRAAHQGPETDGVVRLTGVRAARGQFVPAVVVDSEGVDLVADPKGAPW